MLDYRIIKHYGVRNNQLPESVFPRIIEHVTEMEKAKMKIIGLIVDCMRDHMPAMYDTTAIKTNMQIWIVLLRSLATDVSF